MKSRAATSSEVTDQVERESTGSRSLSPHLTHYDRTIVQTTMARTTLAPTPARLSSLSTRTLSLILELTRSQSLSLPSPSLPSTITKNLSQLREGLETLEGEGDTGEVGRGLRGQYERLVGLAEGLGVEVEGRTGILVDTGEDGPSGDGVDE